MSTYAEIVIQPRAGDPGRLERARGRLKHPLPRRVVPGMPIRDHATLDALSLLGLVHVTLAGPRDGLRDLEVWMQTIGPGAGTPVHAHDCEEVIVVLRGRGEYETEGRVQTFGPGSTIIVPRGAVHRLTNTGPDEMLAVAALGASPVTVTTADGERMHLPWDQHAYVTAAAQ